MMVYKCGYLDCDYAFETKAELLQHAKTSHNRGDPSVYKCAYCTAYFQTKWELLKHVRTHEFGSTGNIPVNDNRKRVDYMRNNDKEDLKNWKPQLNTEYNGYDYTDREGNRKIAVTMIYFRKREDRNSLEEHVGGFNIINNQVKIWHIENGQKIQKFIPLSSCEFSKTRSGRTTYYHLIINENIGESMTNNENSDEGYGMKSKGNEDKEVEFKVRPEKADLVGRLTGRPSAIYLKKRYEDKLNEIWKEFDNTMEKIESQNTKFDEFDTTISGLRQTLQTAKEEWGKSLTSLENLLMKTMRHEWDMWSKTQESRKMRVQKNAPRLKYSDIDEMNFNSMTDFIEKYPGLQSQKNVEKATDAVGEKRKEVIGSQKELDKAISERNLIVSTFEKLTQKAEDNLSTFEELINEAEEKVNKSGYNTSKIRNPLATQYERDATKLELLPYTGKLKERKSILKRVQGQHSKYQRKEFVDMEH